MSEQTIPVDILDDLSSRFIINIPVEERMDPIRVCFQIELAHWFYLDFYCTEENSRLRTCGMKEFTSHIFRHIPFLRPHVGQVDSILEQWRGYKQNVPTFGAIVLNEDLTKVLLVQSYWAKCSWGFPKGKINEDEDPSHCAVREVLEETGFDISNLIDKSEFIESVINDQIVRLYLIYGVRNDTMFKPRTRKEIRSVEWFDIDSLPNNKKDMTPKLKIGVGPRTFFMVVPFVKRLKKWVNDKLEEANFNSSQGKRYRYKFVGDAEFSTKTKKPQAAKNEVKDLKHSSLANTSPLLNKTKDLKNSASKGSLKRNLFGEQTVDQSTNALAQELLETPVKLKSASFPKDVANQVIKRVEGAKKVNTKTPGTGKEKQENNSKANTGKAAKKTSDKLTLHQLKCQPLNNKFSMFDFKPQFWMNFKFDKESILNCL